MLCITVLDQSLLFNIAAYRLGIHIVIGHSLVPLAVIDIGKAVGCFVNLARFGVVYKLVTEGSVALFFAHKVLTFISAFP